MNSTIYLSSPHLGGSEGRYLTDAFDSNWMSLLGPNVGGFKS